MVPPGDQSVLVVSPVSSECQVSKATAAAPGASPSSQSRISSSCRATEPRPVSVEKRSRSARRRTGRELVEHGLDRRVRGHRDRHPVQLVVGPDRGVDVTAAQGVLEALVGVAHGRQVALGQPVDRGPDRDLVHRRHHVPGVADRAEVERGHDRRAAGPGHHQPRLGEAEQGLADRRTADAEPGRQLEVAELLPRRERAVHDRVPEPPEHVVAQQRAPYDG